MNSKNNGVNECNGLNDKPENTNGMTTFLMLTVIQRAVVSVITC